MRRVMWFREDLRTVDNTALYHAAKHNHHGLIGLYMIDATMWHEHHVAACRIELILRGLNFLSSTLKKFNIPLMLVSVKNTAAIPQEIVAFMQKHQANELYFNLQYEVNESHRDQAVIALLTQYNLSCYTFHDQTILPIDQILNQQREYFKVFTAYKRAWQTVFVKKGATKLLKIKAQTSIDLLPSKIPVKITDFVSSIDSSLWPAGEQYAENRLMEFVAEDLFFYDKRRDFPALLGTSRLSPYLATGMISARQCFYVALAANQGELTTGNKGALTWMTELIWREFYKAILFFVPRVSMHQPFKLTTKNIPWKFDKKWLSAWQQGTTGFPIVDAAMRQLNQTGWMHNRLRMIVAMFFTKNLFFDWRIGEEYFMSQLIDGDLAANNGGWQWCASTGTDAAPYFRIFNPVSQSQRFDPDGDFIRQYCPELKKHNNREIHLPGKSAIVDLTASRKHAIAVFKMYR